LKWKMKAIPLLLSLSLALATGGPSFAAPARAVSPKPAANVPAPAAKLPGGTSGREAFFVSLDWVRDNTHGVVLLDARPASLYSGGHIPGAVNAEWQSFCSMKGLPGSRGWATLLAPKSLAARIGALGIDGTRPVIVYGEPGSWGQEGFVALTLRAAGVPGVRVLDGGWPAWRAAGLPVTKEVPKARPVNFALKSFRNDLLATVEHIRERMGSAKLLDVRTIEEYKGARYFSEKRGGHLPGAILLSYNHLIGRDGFLLPDEELKALFGKAGLVPEDEIIVYDTAGVRSAYVTWVLLMLGYGNVKNYDASFHEWAGIPELSVETGDPGELPALVSAPAPAKQTPEPSSPSSGQQTAAVSADTEPKSADPSLQPVKLVPIAIKPVSTDAVPQSTTESSQPPKQAPIAVNPVSSDLGPEEVKPVPPGTSQSPLPAAARITALRWNKDGRKIRAVVDLDRVSEPRVLVKPGVVELSFGALPAQALAGLPSPYEKEVSVVLVESTGQAVLKFTHTAKNVRHFQLEKPYRYVLDFQF
jgi:thiosulfate/3-mercaptopyruvate sulfurtransferase